MFILFTKGSQLFQDNVQKNFPEPVFLRSRLYFEMEQSDWLLLKSTTKIFWKYFGAKKPSWTWFVDAPEQMASKFLSDLGDIIFF